MLIKTVKIQGDGYLVNGVLHVPAVEGNKEYEALRLWLKINTPEPEFTEAEIIEQQAQAINNAIQNHLDKKAQEFRYDNMVSARSYAGYINPFQTEAQALATWCADCWEKAGQIEADVEAGNRPMPTVDEVLAELPVYGA